jgi:hypothetical protein
MISHKQTKEWIMRQTDEKQSICAHLPTMWLWILFALALIAIAIYFYIWKQMGKTHC